MFHKKIGKRLVSLLLSLLIVIGGTIMINPLIASAYTYASYEATIYNLTAERPLSWNFRAGSTSWVSTFNRFSSSTGHDAFCMNETYDAPANGTRYDDGTGEPDFNFYCLTQGDAVASSLGITGNNAYMGIQFALWGKYCGSGDVTYGTDADSRQVLSVARTLYSKAMNCSPDPLHKDYLLQNDTTLYCSKTSGEYISGSQYIIGNYTISGPFDSATVNTTGSTTGVTVTKTGSRTIQVSVPLANITNGYSARIKLHAAIEYIQAFRFHHAGLQYMDSLQINTATGTTDLNEIKDSPQGTFNVYKTDSYNGASLANATFKLTNESTGAVQYKTTNASGYTYFNPLPVGSYTVEETNPPAGYGLTGTTRWTGQQITDSVTSHDYHVQNVPLFGSIKIVKSSEDGIVAGRTFNISGNGVNANITTGADGTAMLNNLYQGTYTVSEVSPPVQYLSPPPQSITVTPNTTTTANFSNILKKGFVAINKTDAETGGMIPNALFGIYNNSNIRIGQLSCVNGYAKSSLINYGNYYLMEETAPTGYVLDSSHLPFSILSNNQLVSLNKSNTCQKGTITVKKTDIETTKPLANGTYEYYAAEDIVTADGTTRAHKDELVDTVTTNSAGIATSKSLYLGNYYIKEKTSPVGYVCDKSSHNVSLLYGSQLVSIVGTDIDVTDKAQKAQLKVTDIDSETKKTLSSSVYEYYAAEDIVTADGTTRAHKDELVDTATTGSDGTATSKLLYLGKYYIKQKTATQGNVLDKDTHNVSLAYKGQDIETYIEPVSLENTPQKAQLKITNIDSETKKTLSSSVYEYYAAEDIVTADGTTRAHKDELVDTATTGSDGTATSKLLYLGKYYIKQKTATQGNVLDKDTHNVSLAYKGQDIETYVEPLSLENTPQKANIKITNIDSETKKTIPMSVYEYYAAEDIVTADGTTRAHKYDLVDTLTTNLEGTVSTKLLYLGKYYVIQKTATQGYVLDNNLYYVNLIYKGQDIETYIEPLSLENTPQKAQVKLTKSDSDTQNLLANGTYEYYAAEDIVTADGTTRALKDELVDTVTTGSDGTAISKLLYLGEYYTKEKTPPIGYLCDNNSHPISITYKDQNIESYVQKIAVTDDIIRGQLGLFKRSTLYHNFLPNAMYGVFRVSNDEQVGTVVTDQQGSSYIDGLAFGEYYVKELYAPQRFHIDNTTHQFSIEENGAMVKKDVFDDPIIGSLTASYTPPKIKYVESLEFSPSDPLTTTSSIDVYTSPSTTELYTPSTGDNTTSNKLIAYGLGLACMCLFIIALKKRNKTLKGNQRMKKLISCAILLALVFSFAPNITYAATSSPQQTAADSSTLVKTKTFTSLDTNFNCSFEKIVMQENKAYSLNNITYKIIDNVPVTQAETIEHEEKFTSLLTKDAPAVKSLSITKNDKIFDVFLKKIEYQLATIKNRKQKVTSYTDCDYQTTLPQPSQTKDIVYDDKISQKDVSATLKFKSLDLIEDWNWRDDVTIPIKVSIYNAEYYTIGNDIVIPYNAEKPALGGHENDLLKYLNLDTTKYQITDVKWDGEPYKSGEVTYRQAIATGKRYVVHYKATYMSTIDLPSVSGYNATAYYEGADHVYSGKTQYTVKATAIYEPINSIVPIVVASSSAGAVAIFIFVLFKTMTVIVYRNKKKIYATRIKKGCINLSKISKKLQNGTITIVIKKGYSRKHVGKKITVIQRINGECVQHEHIIPIAVTDDEFNL